MYCFQPTEYKAIINGYRNFPDLTITIKPVHPEDGFNENIMYISESDYAFWTPGNPLNPYRHTGQGKNIEEAARDALNTFTSQDSELFPNDHVFITAAASNYETAIFIDGNGNSHTYQEVQRIIMHNKNC